MCDKKFSLLVELMQWIWSHNKRCFTTCDGIICTQMRHLTVSSDRNSNYVNQISMFTFETCSYNGVVNSLNSFVNTLPANIL